MEVKDKFLIYNDTRKFEIKLFWHRAIFFGGFISIIFVGYYSTTDKPTIQFLLSVLGLLCSFVWFLANKGSKFWQENWEGHIAHTKEYNGIFARHYKKDECNIFKGDRFSPSKLAISLSFYITLVWVIIIYIQFNSERIFTGYRIYFLIFSLIYGLYVFYSSKTDDDGKWYSTGIDNWKTNLPMKKGKK